MRIIEGVSQDWVWDYWTRSEQPDAISKKTGSDLDSSMQSERVKWRADIKAVVPPETHWSEAEIEDDDIEWLYIVNSGDWSDITMGTYRLTKISDRLTGTIDIGDDRHKGTGYNGFRILSKVITLLKRGMFLEERLIVLSDSEAGPLIILEGNRRASALHLLGRLAGTRVYFGKSLNIDRGHYLVRAAYEDFAKRKKI